MSDSVPGKPTFRAMWPTTFMQVLLPGADGANTALRDLIEKLDAFRKPKRVDQFATVCEADKRGRLGLGEAQVASGDGIRHRDASVSGCH